MHPSIRTSFWKVECKTGVGGGGAHPPVLVRQEVHPQQNVLCILTPVGADHRHVARAVRPAALQANGLQRNATVYLEEEENPSGVQHHIWMDQ